MKGRHEPVRTCVACRRAQGRAGLLRVVRPPGAAEAVLDPTGRAPGRGAYLHADPACLELARRRGALARALRAPVPETVWDLLRA